MKSCETEQRALCKRWGAPYLEAGDTLKVGIFKNVGRGTYPINGLRHSPAGDTSGWYIWCGEEIGEEDDFFLPLHIAHLDEVCPGIKKYLGLAPGWRFLIAPDYEDVWFDSSLLSN